MRGKIVQVSVSPGGIPKRAIFSGHVSFNGIEGDSWAHPRYHGGRDQALLLMSLEVIELLKNLGFPVYPGALGENLTTEGLDVSRWRFGQTYRAGSARIQLAEVRVPCKTIKIYGVEIGQAIYDSRVKAGDFSSPVWAFSGMYARVLTQGVVRAGDDIELESELA